MSVYAALFRKRLFNFCNTGKRLINTVKTRKNLKRIMVRDGICGESANGLKNGCRRWTVWVWVGQAGRSEKAFQTDSMLFLGHY